jgi:hypothetical protein
MFRCRPARRFSSSRCRHRRGLAVVELALCLPILILILLATVETCVMLQLRQNLAVTAYEGARLGILPGVDGSVVQLQCQMLLDDRQINGYTIMMDPADPNTMNVGDPFQVTVAVDCAANSVFGGMMFQGKTLSESVVMRAE